MSVIVFLVLISAANAAAVGWLMWLTEEPEPEKPDEWKKRGNPRSYR